MRLRWIAIATLAILVLPFGTSFARQPATYKVAATLQHSGSVFGSCQKPDRLDFLAVGFCPFDINYAVFVDH